MFFSDSETVAHIWCAEADNPLFLARAAEFPDVWPWLQVGAMVDVSGFEDGATQYVSALSVVEGEDV